VLLNWKLGELYKEIAHVKSLDELMKLKQVMEDLRLIQELDWIAWQIQRIALDDPNVKLAPEWALSLDSVEVNTCWNGQCSNYTCWNFTAILSLEFWSRQENGVSKSTDHAFLYQVTVCLM
jgi:hypothetical protein